MKWWQSLMKSTRTRRVLCAQDRNRFVGLRLLSMETADQNAYLIRPHSVMQAKGYPQMFSIQNFPLSAALRASMGSGPGHLVINRLLMERSYDARHGFFAKAGLYDMPGNVTDTVLGLTNQAIAP